MKGFEEAVEFVLAHEGGYGNDPRDPGGETNFGISKRAYPDVDIKALTKDHAKAIYRQDYWDKLPPNLPDSLAAVVFDCAVNTGLGRAVRLLQAACGVDDDGHWGDKSSAALHTLGEKEAIARFCAHRIRFYAGLKTFDVYGMGWIKRVVAGIVA